MLQGQYENLPRTALSPGPQTFQRGKRGSGGRPKVALEVADALETDEAPSWLEEALVLGGFEPSTTSSTTKASTFGVG